MGFYYGSIIYFSVILLSQYVWLVVNIVIILFFLLHHCNSIFECFQILRNSEVISPSYFMSSIRCHSVIYEYIIRKRLMLVVHMIMLPFFIRFSRSLEHVIYGGIRLMSSWDFWSESSYKLPDVSSRHTSWMSQICFWCC